MLESKYVSISFSIESGNPKIRKSENPKIVVEENIMFVPRLGWAWHQGSVDRQTLPESEITKI
jgi:hypothetical protein